MTEWLDYQFPALLKPGTAFKITNHVVSYIQYCCPQLSLDSEDFENLAKGTSVPLIIDFFADNKELFTAGWDESELRTGMEIINELMEATDNMTKLGEG